MLIDLHFKCIKVKRFTLMQDFLFCFPSIFFYSFIYLRNEIIDDKALYSRPSLNRPHGSEHRSNNVKGLVKTKTT